MSKRVLFLYSDSSSKKDVLLCEEVLRTVLRKFRKAVTFSTIYLDSSPSRINLMKKILMFGMQENDAVIYCGKRDSYREMSFLIDDCVGISASQHFLSGKCLIAPFPHLKESSDDISVTLNTTFSKNAFNKAAELSVQEARRGKHCITLCTDTDSLSDTILFSECEKILGDLKGLDISHLSLEEMVYLCMRELISDDVILTNHDKLSIIKSHVTSLNNFPTGYVVWHNSLKNVYLREFFAYEQDLTCPYASLLLACAGMLEKELEQKSAATWLRRSTFLALEKTAISSRDEFIKQVLFEIGKPIRNRQVTQNDCKN